MNSAPEPISSAAAMGPVTLTVTELARSLVYYQHNIGLTVLARQERTATLGAGNTPLLHLEEEAVTPVEPRAAGLFHFALLLPSRVELARTLQHLIATETRIDGASDHHVSEALYLSDPDGHGIEIYRDRPRTAWLDEQGRFKLTTERLDVDGLLGELSGETQPWRGLDPAAAVGHVHLRVTDVEAAHRFYMHVVGFDHMADYPSARFLSAGGYHHHLGINMWQSARQGQAPEHAAQLRRYTITVPTPEDVAAVRARAEQAGVGAQPDDDGIVLRDPSGNVFCVKARSRTSARG